MRKLNRHHAITYNNNNNNNNNLKEIEKIENYSELRREVSKIWQLKEMTIVIGSLGTITNNFESWLEKLNLKSSIELMQKAALLGTAKIIRKVLET